MTERSHSVASSTNRLLPLLMLATLITPATGHSQQTEFHGTLAGIVDLPTGAAAFRCEPVPPEHTRDDSRGVRNCLMRTRLADGAAVTLHADSTGRVVMLSLGWPRTSDPESTVSRLNAALAMLEQRLGRAAICGRTKIPWQQPYSWETTEWSANLAATRNTRTNGPANVQFSAWIRRPDELLACMNGPGPHPRDDPPSAYQSAPIPRDRQPS
jgi:hypothetical protein